MAGEQAAREAERQVGPYVLRERTARRLVAERTGTPHISVIAVGVVFVLLVVAVAPWLGGTRVPVAVSLVVIGAGLGLLIAAFAPRLQRLTVDMDAREYRLERVYLLARRTETFRVPLDAVSEVRCRQRVWQDAPDATVVRWSVDLARRTRTLRVPLDRVGEVRCRQRVWQDAPDATVVRWSVELVGEGRVWQLAEEDQEEPMQELARLVAEVAGVPRRLSVAEGG